MFENIEDLKHVLVKIRLINNLKMAVLLVNFTETHLLVENSKGYRSLIDRDDIVVINRITPGWKPDNAEVV